MVNEPPMKEVSAPHTGVVIESPIRVVFDVNKFLDDYLKPTTGKVVKWIKQGVEKRREQKQILEKRNFDLIAKLFGIKDIVGLRPGGEHPQFGTEITPDAQEALFYLTSLINSDKLKAQTSWVEVNPAYNIICLGGPVSNPITRQNMGYRYQRSGNKFLRISDFPINFPFSFDLGKNAASSTRRYAGGKVYKAYNWGIISPFGSIISPNVRKGGWLKDDYLLITRMPNLSNPNAWKERKDLIIISGTHSPGTRAIKLLFKNKRELRNIAREVGEARYYQSLLQVPEISHDGQQGDSLPLRIKHIKSEALSIDEKRISKWFRSKKLYYTLE